MSRTSEGGDDPMHWDAQRLADELCSNTQPWFPSNPSKFPSFENLREKLLHYEIDGELLLNWDSHATLQELYKDLGVEKPHHRHNLNKAVAALKKRSTAYQASKQQETPSSPQLALVDSPIPQLLSPTGPDIGITPPVNGAFQAGPANPIKDVTIKDANSALDNQGPPPEERTVKKRRLAPTAIASSSTVPHAAAFQIPTEADVLLKRPATVPQVEALYSTALSSASYLGPQGVTWENILQPNYTTADSDTSFTFSARSHIPGQTLRVNRAVKAFLKPDGAALYPLVKSFNQPIDQDSLLWTLVARAVHNAEETSTINDPILEMDELGDDDPDPQTAREMQEEKEEAMRLAAKHNTTLSVEEVSAVIDDAIAEMVSKWNEEKLPGLRRKAYGIWSKARRDKSLQRDLQSHTRFLHTLEGRIDKLRHEIIQIPWSSSEKVRRQALSLELSVEDRERCTWSIRTLTGPAPARLAPLPRRPKAARQPQLDEEEEIISSDSDSLDDFIDDDQTLEEHILQEFGYDSMELDPDTSTPAGTDGLFVVESIMDGPTIKLEATQPRPQPLQEPELIDLTLETDSSVADLPLSGNSFPEHLDEIEEQDRQDEPKGQGEEPTPSDTTSDPKRGSKPSLKPDFWGKVPKELYPTPNEEQFIKWLWQFESSVLDQVHGAAKDCDGDQSRFWNNNMITALNEQVAPNVLPAIITRSFLVYVHRTRFRPAVFAKLRQKEPGKVLDHKDRLPLFLSILTRVIPCFPEVYLHQDVNEDGQEEHSQRRVLVDRQAATLRKEDEKRIRQQQERAAVLRQRLSERQSMTWDKSRLIVNESKEDNEGFLYIDGLPAKMIKDYQIEGVRFLWNSIIMKPAGGVRHGCLLADEMGLGKTMQVITFLLAVAKAAQSEDNSLRSQIPQDLRASRTLIICPPALGLNWSDELITWDSGQVLGQVYIAASQPSKDVRDANIRRWGKEGGVLIIGYQLFASMADTPGDLQDILFKRPSIVVVDEAHSIKNILSKRRRACSQVTTPAKIALTGSPLSNNVAEYFSMIDWVAPGYLGNSTEFDGLFTSPIERAGWKGATPEDKRLAYIQLKALRKTIHPKVLRREMTVMKDFLPPKREFVFFVPLTEPQRKLYDAFVDLSSKLGDRSVGADWGTMHNLALVCAHPRCFAHKIQEAVQKPGGRGIKSKKAEPSGTSSTSTSEPDEDTGALSLSVARGLQKLVHSITDLDNIKHSWRVRLFCRILDECRKAGDKVLIFSHRISTLDFLEYICKSQRRPFMRVDGQTHTSSRFANVKRFNDPKSTIEILLLSTRACGEGLNIYGANRVIIMDFEHNPSNEKQAIGRAYRLGQKKDVFVYWFVAWGSHEVKLQGRSVYKQQLADRLVDSKDLKPWSRADNQAWVRPLWDLNDDAPLLPPSQAQDLLGKDAVLDVLMKDGELKRGIRSVITTDTFVEREDPAVVAAAEEAETTAAGRSLETGPGQNNASHQPSVSNTVPGRGTPNGSSANQPTPVVPVSTAAKHSNVATTSNGTPRISKVGDGLLEDLKHVIWSQERSYGPGGNAGLHIEDFHKKASHYIQAIEHHLPRLRQKDQIARLTKISEWLARPNVLGAALSGKLALGSIVLAEEASVERCISDLAARDAALLPLLTKSERVKHDDIDHLSTTLRRINRSDFKEDKKQGTDSLRRKEDVRAMREVADRRTARRQSQRRLQREPQPLPHWASDAIRKSRTADHQPSPRPSRTPSWWNTESTSNTGATSIQRQAQELSSPEN